MVEMPDLRTGRPRLCLGLAGIVLLAGACEIPHGDGPGRINVRPSVRITGGAVEGQLVDYRVEFFWFGSDPDGLVDHFIYAIDDTCLCSYEVTTTVSTDEGPVTVSDWVESVDPDSCRAHGVEPAFETADSLWTRTDDFSGEFLFSAEDPVDTGELPTATSWHTFHIKSVDDKGARSSADSRHFNANTVAPWAWLTVPLGVGPALYTTVGSFITPRWKGHDSDSTDPQEQPRGYQMKLVQLDSVWDSNTLAIRYVTDSGIERRNFLIHDSLIVGTTDSVTAQTYLETDWWPKKDDPFTDRRLPIEDLEGGDYAFAVRAVDDAGAVTPDRAFRLADETNEGNVVKIDVNPNLPSAPWITVREDGLGERTFRQTGDIWHVEVPVNVPVQFHWEVDAAHYGSDGGATNYALDIADPGCEVCTDPSGIGGWIGWARRDRMAHPVTFTQDQADEQHVFYIRARDEGFSGERETLAVIVVDLIGFSFENTALYVDDFKLAGTNDCEHDSLMLGIARNAIDPFMRPEEELDVWETYEPPWGGLGDPCYEVEEPALLPLSRIGRYRMIYWNVSATVQGSAIGALTNPSDDAATGVGKYLQNYVAAGGRLILWGRKLFGALLGDFYPQDTALLPAIPANDEPNFGPGSFLWDVLRLRTNLDRAGRGTSRLLGIPCSGLLGFQATELALAEGYPAGEPDPTGYDPSLTAIWTVAHEGAENPYGSRGGMSTLGFPRLRVTGMDTLYTYVPNSWSYEQGGHLAVREACGSAFGSPFRDEPVVFRLDETATVGGRVAVISAPLVFFMGRSDSYVQSLMTRLTEWMFE